MLRKCHEVQTHTTYESELKRQQCPQSYFLIANQDFVVPNPYAETDLKTRPKPLVSTLLPPFMTKDDFNKFWQQVHDSVNAIDGDSTTLGMSIAGETAAFAYNVTTDHGAFYQAYAGGPMPKPKTGQDASEVEEAASHDLGSNGKRAASTPLKLKI